MRLAVALALATAGVAWLGVDRSAQPVPAVADADRPGSAASPGRAPGHARRTERLGPVTIAFAGDVHAEGPSGRAIEQGLPTVRDLLGSADLTVVNLETAITDGGTAADKQFVFRAPASTLSSLREAGVDVVTMANNHALDFGLQGVPDALAASAAAGLPVVGLGVDEDEAYAPHVAQVRGRRIAVLGATQVLDSSLADAWTAGPDSPGLASASRVERLLDAVRTARDVADTVVVYLHWGQERNACPLPRQQELAAQLADAGADVVVGAHAHVLLGGGMLDGTYVDYGLGNFVFSGSRRPETRRSGVLRLTLTGDEVTRADWEPAVLRSGAPVPLEGEQARRAREDKDALRACTGLAPAPGPSSRRPARPRRASSAAGAGPRERRRRVAASTCGWVRKSAAGQARRRARRPRAGRRRAGRVPARSAPRRSAPIR